MVHQPSSPAYIRITLLLGSWLALCPLLSFAALPVTFSLTDGHWIVVPVCIDGSGPYDFIFDTGSNQTLVEPALVAELGGVLVGQKRLVTASASSEVSCYRLRKFQLGSLQVESLDVISQPIPKGKVLSARGILGQDFLARYNFVLDYKSRTITFEENQEFEQALSGRVFALLASAHRRLVLIPPQSQECRPSLFSLDSAAEGVVLFGTDFKTPGFDLDSDGNFERVQTANGLGFVSCAQFRAFRIGDATLKNLRVRLAQVGESLKYRVEDGLLPTSCFQSIYVNNAEKFVAFNPRFENVPRAK